MHGGGFQQACLGADASSMFSIFATNVTKTGFTVNVRTWGQSYMLASTIAWIALVSGVDLPHAHAHLPACASARMRICPHAAPA